MKNRTVTIEQKESKEFCGIEENLKFAGVHLLIELWTSLYLTDTSRIREIIIKAVNACGATILNIDLHLFSPNGGVSGIAVLQESHLSIHTWPEYEYAAIDLFVCGTIDPFPAVSVLKEEFQPNKIEVKEIKRGILT
ncbi:MAG TPA: adenosylmethionine decarboxylase [Desulfobacteraceae bacterium]|nr:adenosylmethionine decarboxylase [Desulfobacteraceae bacterium]